TGSIASTLAETKNIWITSPSALSHPQDPYYPNLNTSVTFDAGPPDISKSSLVANPTNGIYADGHQSTITATLVDSFNNPVSSTQAQFNITGTGNYTSPASPVTNGAGVATMKLSTTVAETKLITIASPTG